MRTGIMLNEIKRILVCENVSVRGEKVPPVVKAVELPNHITLPYVEQGTSTGIPMLLLHGFAGSWRSFELVLPHLNDSVHAFAITQRGHANASAPQSGYRLDDFAGDVAAFMDALHLERAVIVGHSMGSAVAQRLALDYPDRVLGLVLVGASLAARGDPDLQAFWDSTLSTLSDPIDPTFVRGFVDTTLAQTVPPEFFEAMMRDAQAVPARVWKEAFKGRLEEDLLGDLHKIEVPTLILWSDLDARGSRRDQEALEAMINSSRLVVYPGAGHDLHCEEPIRFASDLLSFIEGLAG